MFNRFYVGIEGLKRNCLKGCWKVIGLDLIFIEIIIMMCCAVGRDENDQGFKLHGSMSTPRHKTIGLIPRVSYLKTLKWAEVMIVPS